MKIVQHLSVSYQNSYETEIGNYLLIIDEPPVEKIQVNTDGSFFHSKEWEVFEKRHISEAKKKYKVAVFRLSTEFVAE